MTNKTYSNDVINDLAKIGAALSSLQKSSGINLRTIAKFSSLSVNSVKSVLAGKTGNIASYDMVARSLGSSLIGVIAGICVACNESEKTGQTTTEVSESATTPF